MSGFEALGIACNIMQVIGAANKALKMCKDIYDGRTLDEDLSAAATSLESLSERVQMSCGEWERQGANEDALYRTAERCAIVARALQEEIGWIKKHQKVGDLRATIVTAFRTIWRKERLRKKEQVLLECQRTMETQLLGRICKQNDAAALINSVEFDKLETSMQTFIKRLVAGVTDLTTLVTTEANGTRAHITRGLDETARLMTIQNNSGLSRVHDEIAKRTHSAMQELSRQMESTRCEEAILARREKILQSLKFPSMNARRTGIDHAARDTFRWVLDDGSDGAPPASHSCDSTSNGCLSKTYTSEPIESKPDTSLWDNFPDWLRSESNLYWISGKPGSGKSTLMKYITQSPDTKRLLELWRQDCIILSYFFWKPGNVLQKSTKGMILDLLHQILDTERRLLDILVIRNPLLSRKDDTTDWDETEVQSLLIRAIQLCNKPVCFFIDGLDEGLSGESINLAALIEELRQSSPHVKVCISSRPEHVLEQRYGMSQHLQLHYLTDNDIRLYLRAHLGSRASIMESDIKSFEDIFVRKASGVFLWVVLAIKSLSDGLDCGDTREELHRRMELLPAELTNLYEDMWTRLNLGRSVYSRDGALFIESLIAAYDWEVSYDSTLLIAFMSMHDQELGDSILRSEPRLPSQALSENIDQFTRNVTIRSAGLLEFYDTDIELRPEFQVFTNFRVDFVHRTAFDFLCNTEEGERIRNRWAISKGSMLIKVFRGALVRLRATTSHNGDLLRFLEFLDRIPHTVFLEHREEFRCMLSVLHAWYDQGYFVSTTKYDPHAIMPVLFPAQALDFGTICRDYVLHISRTGRVDPEMATSLLRWAVTPSCGSSHPTEIIHALLQLGAKVCDKVIEYGTLGRLMYFDEVVRLVTPSESWMFDIIFCSNNLTTAEEIISIHRGLLEKGSILLGRHAIGLDITCCPVESNPFRDPFGLMTGGEPNFDSKSHIEACTFVLATSFEHFLESFSPCPKQKAWKAVSEHPFPCGEVPEFEDESKVIMICLDYRPSSTSGAAAYEVSQEVGVELWTELKGHYHQALHTSSAVSWNDWQQGIIAEIIAGAPRFKSLGLRSPVSDLARRGIYSYRFTEGSADCMSH